VKVSLNPRVVGALSTYPTSQYPLHSTAKVLQCSQSDIFSSEEKLNDIHILDNTTYVRPTASLAASMNKYSSVDMFRMLARAALYFSAPLPFMMKGYDNEGTQIFMKISLPVRDFRDFVAQRYVFLLPPEQQNFPVPNTLI
jgi:hypothetical protein